MKISDPVLHSANGFIYFTIELTPDEACVLAGPAHRRETKIEAAIQVTGLPIKSALRNKTRRAVEAGGAVVLRVVGGR